MRAQRLIIWARIIVMACLIVTFEMIPKESSQTNERCLLLKAITHQYPFSFWICELNLRVLEQLRDQLRREIPFSISFVTLCPSLKPKLIAVFAIHSSIGPYNPTIYAFDLQTSNQIPQIIARSSKTKCFSSWTTTISNIMASFIQACRCSIRCDFEKVIQ